MHPDKLGYIADIEKWFNTWKYMHWCAAAHGVTKNRAWLATKQQYENQTMYFTTLTE